MTKRKTKIRLAMTLKQLAIVSLLSVASVGAIFMVSSDVLFNHHELSQEELAKRDFINRLVPVVQDVYRDYGVLPSISLSQAILESDWGRSELAQKYYNLYGVKAYGNAPKANMQTKEFENGQWMTIDADFRAYNSWRESVVDHALLMVNGVNWNNHLYQDVITAKDYKQAATALQQAGYATDPTYSDKLIILIEEYQLYQYDQLPEDIAIDE
ncbi:Flagellum-specific peptidoglycan hydrolase FlgJ [Granulicatella balaenopterae]|uniref:Flagellum-specific peptidoglycan hydrolase FlgJ n=1 Tax=Granulicatella balaenopterae TaxID=137733 RepID=A0A1H9M5T9_9LACT|nr:glycoside hydrolase family 73 protein [Granulicatella balaenopterae]SER18847.1 Flagellum-specific peptidoglycan hydrolase FlgJ [Granulicatella balaenopterae]